MDSDNRISEEQDRLIDMLLREELGREAPPDLSRRILQQAFSAAPRRAFWRHPAMAAAALVAVMVGYLTLPRLFGSRTVPTVTPAVPSGPNVAAVGPRRIEAKDKALQVALGEKDYVRIDLDPKAALLVTGEGRAATVQLERGKITCDVDRGVGTFAVNSDAGSVAVQGTKFSVQRGESRSAEGVAGRRLEVKVLSGSVLLSTGGSQAPLAEKENGGTAAGILTAKSEQWIDVRLDGEREPRRYIPRWIGGMPAKGGGLDKAMLATFKGLPAGNRVSLVWKFEETLRVLAIQVLVPHEKSGVVTGRVVAKGDAWMEICDEAGLLERYSIPWRRDAPDKELIHTLEGIKAGETVRIEWTYTERKRLDKITRVK